MLFKNKLCRILASVVALAALTLTLPQTALAQDRFMKGIWVSTVYNIDYPEKPTTNIRQLMNEADKVLNNCQNLGFNTIFLQFHPTGDALYNSDIFPYSRWITGSEGTAPDGDIDILEYWIYCAHERGMELHAWINPYRITIGNAPLSSLSPDNPARQHPEYTVEYNGNYYYNPALPEVRQLITDCAVELAEKYPIDGIHMDDYFYPGDIDDYDDYMAYNTENLSLADWRRSNTDALVTEISAAMRERNVTFGISPRGIWANKSVDPRGSDTNGKGSYDAIYADSLKWIKEGLVDYIAPQIYWEIGNSAADYETLLGWWSDAVDGTDVRLCIGMADYKANEADEGSVWYGGTPLKEEFDLNDIYGTVDGEIHFSYKDVAGNQTLWDMVSERNFSIAGYEEPAPSYDNGNNVPAIDIIREYGLFNGYEGYKFPDWFIVMLQNLILQHSFK
ncbi:MAG: family 10 glycosylhydrolase [Clostridia bacterium]|nr:family 10 glycosylhydrolase [Clostridia bacterium]